MGYMNSRAVLAAKNISEESNNGYSLIRNNNLYI